jgi:hypothetical protein
MELLVMSSRALSAIRGALVGPRRHYWLAAIVSVVMLVPCLWVGLVFDDLTQSLIVRHRLPLPIGPLDLFRFVSRDPAERRYFLEIGYTPWWVGSETQVNYFRPLAALTHVVDYRWWPSAGWLMHVENLLWYAGLVLAADALYRRWIPIPWVAGLAAFLYAFDRAHAFPVAWVANRNALMSALFGVLALHAHDRWRSARQVRSACTSGVWLLLSLLSAESGVAILGYLVAYALFVDRGDVRARCLSLVPSLVLVASWRAGYAALGHGVTDTGWSADPLGDPIRFAIRTANFLPIFLQSEVWGIPGDLLSVRNAVIPWAALACAGALLLFGWVARPLLSRNESSRFFAAGAILSTLPLAGTIPCNRYLLWTGIGTMGLVAQLVEGAVGVEAVRGRLTPVVVGAVLLCRGVVSPSCLPFDAAALGFLRMEYNTAAASLPEGPSASARTVVLLNAPGDLSMDLSVMRMARGEPVPAHMYVLTSAVQSLRVSRRAPDSMDVDAAEGWFPNLNMMRSGPFRAGETVRLERMRVEVLRTTADGRAKTVRFTFPVPLDDGSLAILRWGDEGLEPFAVPPTGETSLVPPPPWFTLPKR